MKRLSVVFLSILLACASAAADAQTPARVRGTITAIDGNTVSVRSREGKDLRIELAPNATFSYMKKLSLADVKPGSTLTNGMVTAMVETGNGRELTLSYKDGTQRVVVPANIPIVATQDGVRPPQ